MEGALEFERSIAGEESMNHAPRLTERKFGLVMGIALSLIGLLVFFVFAGNPTWLWGIAAFFLLSAVLFPAYLLPINRLWEKLAARLAYFNNHLLLGLFFYLFVLPAGIMMRTFGRDPMQRRRDPKVLSYLTKVGRQAGTDTYPDMF
jgi:hypothetical protein